MTAGAPSRIVVFRVAGQLYGLDVMVIERVVRHVAPRQVPFGPESIHGVVDIEGRLVPVVDLRARLGTGTGEGGNPRVLLVRHAGEVMGLVVDQVLDVRALEAGEVEPTPDAMARGLERPLFTGTFRRGSDVVLLADHAALVHAARPVAA